MKITKSTLKQLIKEEYESMYEEEGIPEAAAGYEDEGHGQLYVDLKVASEAMHRVLRNPATEVWLNDTELQDLFECSNKINQIIEAERS